MNFAQYANYIRWLPSHSRALRRGALLAAAQLCLLLGDTPLLPPSWGRADTITLGADIWCPYTCDPNDGHSGILVDIARYAFSRAGHSVSFKIIPWSRAIEEARAGRLNGIVGAFKSDVPDFVYPETAQYSAENRFFVSPKSGWRFAGIDSLSSIALGVVQDYTYDPKLDAYIRQFSKNPSRIQFAKGEDPISMNIEKVIGGRIGALIDDGNVVTYILGKRKTPDALTAAGSLDPVEIFVAFSPKLPTSSSYAKILAEGTQAMKENGELAKLESAYGIH